MEKKAKVSIVGNTKGIDKLEKKLKNMQTNSIFVGYLSSDHDKYESGETVVKVAQEMHFGVSSKKIPPRPFLDRGIIKGEKDLSMFMKKNLKQVTDKDQKLDRALNRIGLFAVDLIQSYIENGKFKELSRRTVEAKGSDKPLIDTGLLKNSVNFIIKKSKGK